MMHIPVRETRSCDKAGAYNTLEPYFPGFMEIPGGSGSAHHIIFDDRHKSIEENSKTKISKSLDIHVDIQASQLHSQ